MSGDIIFLYCLLIFNMVTNAVAIVRVKRRVKRLETLLLPKPDIGRIDVLSAKHWGKISPGQTLGADPTRDSEVELVEALRTTRQNIQFANALLKKDEG